MFDSEGKDVTWMMMVNDRNPAACSTLRWLHPPVINNLRLEEYYLHVERILLCYSCFQHIHTFMLLCDDIKWTKYQHYRQRKSETR